MSKITKFPNPKRPPTPPTELAPLNAISREELEFALAKLGDVATEVGKRVIHCHALNINSDLQDIEAVFLGMLPGGERFDKCEGCGVSLGCDDKFVSDVESNYLCPTCAATCIED